MGNIISTPSHTYGYRYGFGKLMNGGYGYGRTYDRKNGHNLNEYIFSESDTDLTDKDKARST